MVAMTAPSNIMSDAAVSTPRVVLASRYDQKVTAGSKETPASELAQTCRNKFIHGLKNRHWFFLSSACFCLSKQKQKYFAFEEKYFFSFFSFIQRNFVTTQLFYAGLLALKKIGVKR